MIATLWLSGCATAGSDHTACPPVVEYSPADQTRVATEVGAMAEGAMLVRMMSDYTVLREQARACR